MIVIGEVGSYIMNISSKFPKYAEEVLGLKDPFKANREYFNRKYLHKRNEDGSISIDFNLGDSINEPYNKEYINNYIIQRNIYEFNKVMEKFGYETAMKYCNQEGIDMSKIIPCQGADRQCNMNCIYFKGGCRKW